MRSHEINVSRSAQLWALEPAVAPISVRAALIIGAILGVLLWTLVQGVSEDTSLQNWHGNVAASESTRDTR